MVSKCMRGLVVPVIGLLIAMVFAGSASAASNPFGCRASAARVSTLSSAPSTEPYVANPSEFPCVTDSSGLSSGSTDLATVAGLGDASIGPAEVYTDSVDDATDLGASALASVNGGSIPTGAGTLSFVGPAQATADYECEDGVPQASANSTLDAVQLGTRTINLPSGVPDTVQLGGGSYIALNQTITTGTSITEQLVHVHIAGSVDIVEGEATVAQPASNACAGLAGSNGDGRAGHSGTIASDICPVGSMLIASTGMCEIVTSGRGGAAKEIVVSAPGAEEILGGSVLSLAEARKLYGAKTACLNGAGPQYVVVGTKKVNRITVRKARMRVLGLAGNDRITVEGGNRTCVNGGAGNDVIVNRQKNRVTVFGANGNDRITLGNGPGYVLGGRGNDRIIAGNGKVDLQGNAGRDYIRAGNGTDRLNGGNGNDTIIAGTGTDRVNGGPGNNRLTASGKRAFVQAGKGRSIAYVRRANVRYARTHGVRTVHLLTH